MLDLRFVGEDLEKLARQLELLEPELGLYLPGTVISLCHFKRLGLLVLCLTGSTLVDGVVLLVLAYRTN